jgi:RNA polymerase sigma-70 factor (ECF subfamily)
MTDTSVTRPLLTPPPDARQRFSSLWLIEACRTWANVFWLLFHGKAGQPIHLYPSMGTDSTPSIPTRQSLLVRLKDWDDSTSWKDFFDTYWKLIYGVARKAGLTDAEAQDVVQDTVVAVAKKIPDFDYDPQLGSFKGWLMRLTRWRITDQFRKKGYESGGRWFPREQPVGDEVLGRHAEPIPFDLEQAWNEEWEKAVMEAALKKLRQQASQLQYQMFYLHVIKAVPAREVARRLEVKLAEVYFAKYKLSAIVRRHVRALERKML